MSLKDFAIDGGAAILILTLIQITPIKLNPWSAVGKVFKRGLSAFGKLTNAEVIHRLEEIEATQKETRRILDEHIQMDDERNADEHRLRILQFNTELLRGMSHTEEDFIEILAEIDFYESYCEAHPDYKNNRAVHAIANIGRVYDERLQKRDFL